MTDPFPARLEVEIVGEVLEAVGFARHANGLYRVERLSFWDALAGLEGRYLSPVPLLAQLEPLDEYRLAWQEPEPGAEGTQQER